MKRHLDSGRISPPANPHPRDLKSGALSAWTHGCFNIVFEPNHDKTCSCNKGTYQPAHSCGLISTFVIRFLDSVIPIVAISEI